MHRGIAHLNKNKTLSLGKTVKPTKWKERWLVLKEKGVQVELGAHRREGSASSGSRVAVGVVG